MKEIDILKKLSHPHMVQLVGTYTQRRHPRRMCGDHTLPPGTRGALRIEASKHGIGLDEYQEARLSALDHFSNCRQRPHATDNERGIPRYFALEVFEWKPNKWAGIRHLFSRVCVTGNSRATRERDIGEPQKTTDLPRHFISWQSRPN